MHKLAKAVVDIQCESYFRLHQDALSYLQGFYLQVEQQTVSFTANEFFPLNLSLFAAVAMGIVSYEIILMQFYAADTGSVSRQFNLIEK